MKTILRFALPLTLLPSLALAVYAPIPEQEQGKALTVRLGGSIYHDSNIFGAATNEIDSMVYNVSAKLSYNGSLSDQTFATGAYEISNDYVPDRPGDENLVSHTLNARVAHAFSSATNIDVSALYNVAQNPESLLAGVPVNTDQSYKRAQVDGRFTTTVGQKTGAVAKYRFIDFNYDDTALGNQLDRAENLFGLEGTYALLPETKLVAEYRYQTIGYDVSGAFKDKDSHFFMGGVDYNPSKQLFLSARAGLEDRSRDSAPDTTSPYVELSSRYAYAEGSFISGGYVYTLEESSDIVRFLDAKVNRFFANVQHRLTGTLSASGSLTYEPSQLQGRGLQADLDETTTRFGLGLAWQPNKNFTLAGTYDFDDVNSDDANREQNRSRFGVSAHYTF
ncbi:outer membrane beta-barrel protein [Oleiharenicola lentus]|uniref:outer membrane beta-barrel protein n=1 Tax=Oleiharenicola lentus TaxID=2508720 RepID=UPI003F66D242